MVMSVSPVRVLLVEDDEDDYFIIKSFLMSVASEGYQVKWVSDYNSAMKALMHEKHDVCLLDYRLGERDGIEIMDEAVKNGCSVPIIVITGAGSYKIDLEAMSAGAADFLDKSQLSPQILERVIRYAMERKRAERELRSSSAKLRRANDELSDTLERLSRTQDVLYEQNKRLRLIQQQLKYQNEELITAREALEIERRRYLDLFEYAPDGYLVTDDHGSILEANRAAEELLGAPRDILLRRDIGRFVANEELPSFYDKLNRLQRLKGVRGWEVSIRRMGDDIVPVEISITTVLPRMGEEISLRWSMRDTSDRKRAEESLRESEKQLRLLSSKLLTAQEEERKRIARDLHDSISSALSAIKFSLQNTLKKADQGETDPEAIRHLISITQLTIDEARRMMTDLRPSMLDDLGITTTIGWFCKRFQSIYTSIHVETEIEVEEHEVPESLKIVIFRVMQEALNNIAKYSGTELVNLSLVREGDRIELAIEDNGVGFDLASVGDGNGTMAGLGLTSMRERTELSGGSFAIESKPGEGTVVRTNWPCTAQIMALPSEEASEGRTDIPVPAK